MDVFTQVLEWSSNRRASTVPAVLRLGASLFDHRTGRVESPQGERRLRPKELELLVHLYEHTTQTFSREKLLWRCRPGLLTRTADQTISTLRKKIEFDPDRPQFLQTVYGIGYRLVLEVERKGVPSFCNPSSISSSSISEMKSFSDNST